MKKIFLLLFIIPGLFITTNLCQAQQQKNFFPILRNTFWATNTVACDTLIFITGRDVMIYNCSFSMDTINGSYRFLSDDTVFAEFTSSTGLAHFPKTASYTPPAFEPFRTTYLLSLKDNTLSTIHAERKNKEGDWVSVSPADGKICSYNWYKAEK